MKGDCAKYGEVGEYAFGELGLYPGAAGDMPPAPIGLIPIPRSENDDAASSPPLTASGENAAASPFIVTSCDHVWFVHNSNRVFTSSLFPSIQLVSTFPSWTPSLLLIFPRSPGSNVPNIPQILTYLTRFTCISQIL